MKNSIFKGKSTRTKIYAAVTIVAIVVLFAFKNEVFIKLIVMYRNYFRNVYDKLELEFRDENEARNILELARYANVHTQKPLTDDELRFIYHYPDIAAKVMTVSPFYEPTGELEKRLQIRDAKETLK